MARSARIGSVTSGTFRPEDLLHAFADELESLGGRRYNRFVNRARRIRSESEARDVLEDLEQALEALSPPYCYFGAHPGDGADIGYWPDWDAIESDRRDGSLPSGGELPADGSKHRQYLHVSDHGNAELYHWHASSRRWRSVWGAV